MQYDDKRMKVYIKMSKVNSGWNVGMNPMYPFKREGGNEGLSKPFWPPYWEN